MAKIVMCRDTDCPRRATCYRFIEPLTLGPKDKKKLFYFDGSPRNGRKCDKYWPLESKKFNAG